MEFVWQPEHGRDQADVAQIKYKTQDIDRANGQCHRCSWIRLNSHGLIRCCFRKPLKTSARQRMILLSFIYLAIFALTAHAGDGRENTHRLCSLRTTIYRWRHESSPLNPVEEVCLRALFLRPRPLL